MRPRRALSRRRLIQGGLALPALDLFGSRRALAATPTVPKRLLMVHQPQGTVLADWVPVGTERDFTLPFILEPLAPWRDRAVFVAGLDNRIAGKNSVGNAHQQANLTQWTAMPFSSQDGSTILAGGPSIEQVVAERLAGVAPLSRVDLCAGGSTGNGVYSPSEESYFWHGAEDPVSFYNDPLVALIRVFGDPSMSEADAWAQRARRSAVLDQVMAAFGELRPRVGYEDSLRLDAHLEKVAELEARIVAGAGACVSPTLDTPAGYDYGYDDDVSTPLMNDLLVAAFACDLTRVATFHFANAHDHTFPWLWEQNGGPIVDTSRHENWHAMVHEDYQPGIELVYRWYMEMLADLLDKMSRAVDADGDNLLDTTLVVVGGEYSSGRHWTRSIPAMLLGNLGGAEAGRFLDYMPGTVEELEAAGGYLDSDVTTSQLLVSILQRFGFADERFGNSDEDVPAGGLPGL